MATTAADGCGPANAAPSDGADLAHPCGPPPASGRTVEVAPGVRWIRMPLPFALDHINLWAIRDGPALPAPGAAPGGDGWAIVDTGLRTDDTTRLWRELFARAGADRPTRVFVTHMHPDHVGMAGWLTRTFGVRLWMSRLEYLTCRVTVGDHGREAPPDAIAFYRRAGWGDAAIEAYRARFGGFGRHVHPLPESYRRLVDGEVLRIGEHDWRVVVGRGHSPEHACLHCPALGVFVAGDQVLPRISSNVSVHPIEPDADPMSDWLDSLAKLRREVADDVLVLPAHNEPFRGLHARLDALARGQARALGRLAEALGEPRRAVDVFAALFARPIPPEHAPLLGMATGEALACLNHLRARGEATCDIDADGVGWWRRT